MTVVIYARFSSHSQTEQSIEGQLKTCYEYANANGHTVVGEYIDRAISGTTDNRPEFQRMIADSSRRLFSGVLVYQLDRFARNRYDSANYKAALKKNGVRVLSARENISEDASGILIESVLEGMAEYYSAELSQKIRRGMDLNGQKCLCTGGNVALGYKVVDKHFQIDEETAPIVRAIFSMYANGKTITEIITIMNERHIVTARGNAFNKNSLRKILRNKRYIGIYTYRGTETPGGIPRIVDDETFYQVQDMLDRNKAAPARIKAKTEYLLTTKLFCGYCKEMMTGVSGTSHTAATHNYYVCNNRKKKLCKKENVRKEHIENIVLAKCREMLTDKNIDRISREVARLSEQEAETPLLQQMRKQLTDNERKKKNLLVAVMECEIESVRKALYEQLALIEKQVEDLKFQITKEMAGQVRLTAPEIKFFLIALKNGDPDTDKHKKTLIAIFVNAIYLYDDQITFIFNSGDKPITITGSLLGNIEEDTKAVPTGKRFVFRTNASTIVGLDEPVFLGGLNEPYFFNGGFAVTIWLEYPKKKRPT